MAVLRAASSAPSRHLLTGGRVGHEDKVTARSWSHLLFAAADTGHLNGCEVPTQGILWSREFSEGV